MNELFSILNNEPDQSFELAGSKTSRIPKPIPTTVGVHQPNQYFQNSLLLYPQRIDAGSPPHVGSTPSFPGGSRQQGGLDHRLQPAGSPRQQASGLRLQGAEDRSVSDLLYVSLMEKDKDMIPYPRMG